MFFVIITFSLSNPLNNFTKNYKNQSSQSLFWARLFTNYWNKIIILAFWRLMSTIVDVPHR